MDTSTGSPMLLTAGTHYIRKAEFKWGSFLDLSQGVNSLGALKLIRVDRGQVTKGPYTTHLHSYSRAHARISTNEGVRSAAPRTLSMCLCARSVCLCVLGCLLLQRRGARDLESGTARYRPSRPIWWVLVDSAPANGFTEAGS